MKLTYRQEGTSKPRVWDNLSLGRFRSREIEAVERVTKMPWGTEFKSAILMGNMLARRALLWTLIKRDHPKYQFNDLDPFDDEVTVELSATEWQEHYDDVAQGALAPGKTEEDREFGLAAIAEQIRKAKAAEAPEEPADEADEGKAPAAGSEPSENSSTGTGSPSAS